MDPLELEALFVRIYADYQPFVKAVDVIRDQTAKLNATLKSIETTARAAAGGVNILARSFERLAAVTPTAGMSAMIGTIGTILTSLQSLQAAQITAGLNSLSEALQNIAEIKTQGLASQLRDIGNAFLQSKLWSANVGKAAVNLSALGAGISSLRTAAVGTGLDTAMTSLATAVTGLGRAFETAKLHLKRVGDAAINLGAVAVAAGEMAKVDAGKLTAVSTAVKDSIGAMWDGLKGGTAAKVVGGLTNIQGVLAKFVGLDLTALAKIRPALQDMFGVKGTKDSLAKLLTDAGLHTGTMPTLPDPLRGIKASAGRKGPLQAIEALNLLSEALGRLSRVSLGGVPKQIQDFLTKLPGVVSNLPDTTLFRTWLNELGGAIKGVPFSRLVKGLDAVQTSLTTAFTGVLTAKPPDITPLIAWLNQLGSVSTKTTRAYLRIGKNLTILGGELSTGITAIRNIGSLPDPKTLTDWLTAMGSVGPQITSSFLRVARGIKALADGLTAMAAANVKAAITNGQAVLQWVSSFKTISPQAAGIFVQIGRGLTGFANLFKAAQTAGVAMPPVTNNINNITNAAGGASGAIGNLGRRFSGLLRPMSEAGFGLRYFRYGLLGIGAVGVGLLARYDDTLTRTLAHMRDWNQESRPILNAAIVRVSSGSRTGAVDLAHGLDAMVHSGMNAAMAARALSIAETFATASGMKMEDATRKLVDIQNNLGMTGRTVEEHYANMTEISDRFVSMAPMVGSSVQQLTEAFGDRFTTAMRQVNMSLEQGLILQGIYSFRNIRGADASDRASRAIHELTSRSAEGYWVWKRLGVEVFNAAGGMRNMSDIARDLDRALGSVSPAAATARLMIMGLEQRAVNAIVPLMGMADAFEYLEEQSKKFGGAANMVAEMMRRDIVGQFKILWNNVSNVARVVGEHLAPAIGALGSAIGSLMQWFMGLNPAIQAFVIWTAIAVTSLRPMLWLLSSLGKTVLTPIFLIGSAIRLAAVAMASLAMGAYNAAVFIGGALYSAVSLLVSGVKTLWGWFWLTFGLIKTGLGAVVSTLVSWTKTIASALMSLVTGVFTNIIPAVLKVGWSILTGIIPFIINLVSWFFALTAAAALFITLFLGIGSLFAAVGAAVGMVWAGIISIARGFFTWLEEQWGVLREAGIRTFAGVRGAAIGFFSDLGEFIVKAAGFFWNFEHNAEAVFGWLKRNWRGVLTDIESGGVAAVTNIVHNIGILGTFIWSSLGAVWQFVWSNASRYGQIAYAWLETNWNALWNNAGLIFRTFGENLLHNWGVIVGEMGSMVTRVIGRAFGRVFDDIKIGFFRVTFPLASRNQIDEYIRSLDTARETLSRTEADRQIATINRVLENGQVTRERAESDIAAINARVPRGMGDVMGQMRSPLQGMDRNQFSSMQSVESILSAARLLERAGVTTLRTMLGMGESGETFGAILGEGITDAFDTALDGMRSLFHGFESVVTERLIPLLNLNPPDNAIQKMMEMFRNFFRPAGDTDAGNLAGKQGPGFQFKQISTARYVIGGQTAEMLDYQQLVVLKAINDKLTTIISIGRGQMGVFPPLGFGGIGP